MAAGVCLHLFQRKRVLAAHTERGFAPSISPLLGLGLLPPSLALSLGVEFGVLQECLPSAIELSVKTCTKRGSEFFFNSWNWRHQLLYLATPHRRAMETSSPWEQKPWVVQKLQILITSSGCFLVICCMGMWHLPFHWCRCHVQLPALAPLSLLGCILLAVDEVYSQPLVMLTQSLKPGALLEQVGSASRAFHAGQVLQTLISLVHNLWLASLPIAISKPVLEMALECVCLN